MLESIRHRLIWLCALGIFLSAVLVRPQETRSTRQRNAFTIVHEILQASYPQIFGNGWYVGFVTGQPIDDVSWGEFHGFTFSVTRFAPGMSWNTTADAITGKITPPPENSTFLEGSSWVDYQGHGRIIRLIFEGDLACSRQNKAIRELVQSHPEWSEDEATRALKKAGAHYGPDDKQQFLQSIHLDKFERVLGRLQIRLVEFQGLSPDHVGNFAAPFWVVQAEGHFPDGTRRTYGFSFEPFEGKLTGLSEIPNRSFAPENKPVARPNM
jgi:hypothetical protein